MSLPKITAKDKENYSLREKEDYIILGDIKNLEKMKMTARDKEIIRLIKTQLRKDWRTPLIKELRKIAKRYKK